MQIKYGLNSLPSLLKSTGATSVFVLVDEHTAKHCLPLIKKHIPVFTKISIKSGESNKNLQTCEKVWQTLIQKNADRHSLLINLGGGVVTDLGSFCASVYMRGIRFVNIPTTLLAMVDASIGGKTGIDYLAYKNMIGSFANPEAICIDTIFLKTLPAPQLLSASAEIFKHAILQGRNETKIHLEKKFSTFSDENILSCIKKSVKYKLSIVASDPKEAGDRKKLNLGHTIGHALESYMMLYHKPMLHGEAIALGLLAEAFIAHSDFDLDYNEFLKTVFWYDLNFKKPSLESVNLNTHIKLMRKDKKNRGATIRMVLPVGSGKVRTDIEVAEKQIMDGLKFVMAF